MLSSKFWMCLFVSGTLLTATTHSMAQSSTRYSSPSVQRSRSQPVRRSVQAGSSRQQLAPPVQSRVAQGYVPQHLRSGIQTGVVAAPIENPANEPAGSGGRTPVAKTAQVISGAPIGGSGSSGSGSVGGPVIGSVVDGPIVQSPIAQGSIVQGPIVQGPIVHGPIVHGPIVGGTVLAGGSGVSTHTTSGGGCSSCASGGCSSGFGGPVDLVGQNYFHGRFNEGCNIGCGEIGCGLGAVDCCNNGCYLPSAIGACWLRSLWGTLSAGEFFAGGVGFRSQQFQVPGSTDVFDDSSFGFQGGFNVGIPLRVLTAGLLSGQFGIRHVSSNFDGNSFSDGTRNQTFFTAGVFRRVDYGLQIGVVADVLREEWFTDTQTVQLRGDLAWVYPSGTAFGFRFTQELEDDDSDGSINGFDFNDLTTGTLETYRFYFRKNALNGGYLDVFGGWSDDDQWLVGMEHDVPVTETVSLQSSLTYLSGEDLPVDSPFADSGNEAWNLSVGVAWRPRGRSWYDSYDTPLLPVADNGTLILSRGQ